MGLKTTKKIQLPRLDNIEDPEVKKALQLIKKALEKMNATTLGDLTGLDERITVLEP